MTPADARNSKNQMKLQNRYTLIYKKYNPEKIILLKLMIVYEYQHIKVYLIKDIKRIGQ